MPFRPLTPPTQSTGFRPISTSAAPVDAPQDNSSANTPGILGSIARFTGVDKLGIGLGRAINNATGQPDQLLALSKQHTDSTQQLVNLLKDPSTSPEQRQRIQAILKNNTDYALNAYGDVSTGNLTNKEVLGSAAQTALNIGLAGSAKLAGGASGVLAKEAAPAIAKAGILAAGKRVAVKAATGFASGGALGTAQGLSEGKNVGESLKQGLVTGTVSSILGAGAQTLSEGVRALTAPQLSKSLYDSAIGVSKKVVQSGKSPSVALIKDGVVGTAQKIYDRAQGIIDEVDPKINSILAKSDKSIAANDVFKALADGVNESVGNTGDGAISSSEIRTVIQDSLPQVRTLLDKENLSLGEANKLRQIMDRTLGDRAFTGATLPFKKDVLYDASNSLRRLVQSRAPETEELFKKYATQVQVVKALNNEMSKPHVLRHMLSLLAGVGGGPAGFAAGVANEVGQSTIAKTSAAVALSKVHQILERSDTSIQADILKRLAKFGVQNTVKTIVSKSL